MPACRTIVVLLRDSHRVLQAAPGGRTGEVACTYPTPPLGGCQSVGSLGTLLQGWGSRSWLRRSLACKEARLVWFSGSWVSRQKSRERSGGRRIACSPGRGERGERSDWSRRGESLGGCRWAWFGLVVEVAGSAGSPTGD